MTESNSSGSSAGVSSFGGVQIVFLIMKLCKSEPIVGWPWWQVMLPLEISVGLMCCIGCSYTGLLCWLKDDTVSTPGTDLSAEQRDMLYNLTQVKQQPSKELSGSISSPDSNASTVQANHSKDFT